MSSSTLPSSVVLPGPFGRPRLVTLFASLVVALGAGTNYVYSAYAPQLGDRLNINHTKLNLIGLAGNVGNYSTGPLWGKLVDTRGPKLNLTCAFIFLFIGYSGIRAVYDAGPLQSAEHSINPLTFFTLLSCGFLTGAGGNAGITAAVNASVKTFPDTLRASVTGIVLSGFGLSAFLFSTIAHYVFPGDTSHFLLVLALGTALPMVAGFFLVRAVPLSISRSLRSSTRGASRTPLLREPTQGHAEEQTTPMMLTRESSVDVSKDLDIHGWRLWCTFDFWLLVSIMTLLTGTGLMYINNVGSISQALYASSLGPKETYSPVVASSYQSTQVSAISITNCLGRIFIGLVSDFFKHKFQLPRSHVLMLVSSTVLISQILLASISGVGNLWIASCVLGVGHGSIFGVYPAVVIEWFGMAHMSENYGFISLAPILGGNMFSVAFGRNLDAHESESISNQCLEGKACYVDTIYLTIVGCFAALGLSIYASIRDRRRIQGGDEYERVGNKIGEESDREEE